MPTRQTESPGHTHLVKRVRAFHTKTADGCKTCRVRRIKCDQEKPACKRCSSTGRRCDGYPPSPLGTAEGSSRSLTPSTGSSSSSPLSLPISSNILEDHQERRSFFFFCRHTFPQLSGSFDSNDFWQRLLQAAHHETAIRHAAVALGSLHERFENNSLIHPSFNLSGNEDHDVFAMQQYSKAIKALVGSNGGQEQAADVALITCVLFIYFEILRGHHKTAISHINGGIKILSSLHDLASSSSSSPSAISRSRTPYISTPTLTVVFSRFDSQASAIFHDRKRALLSADLDNPANGYVPDIPERFSGLEEARNSLEYVKADALRTMERVDRRDMNKVRIMLACVQSAAGLRLRLWDGAFHAFVRKGRRGGGKEREWKEAVNVLRVQRIFMSFYFCVDLERAVRDEGLWDEYTEDFEEVIRLSEAIIGEGGPGEGEVKRVLCLDAGIVLPLYFVATKCRVRGVRWKAIELLRRTERQEGLWNSVLTALVAERLVTIEEEWLVEGEVQREKRISGVEVSFQLEERRASLRYGRLEVGLPDGPPPREMEWIEGFLIW